jgi:prolyl 4-hydroxylase
MTWHNLQSSVRYEPEQYYRVHHDYVLHNIDRQQGVRMLTVFLYLSDVEAGGGTNFDQLDITVMPKRGRALLWPSVLNSKPHDKDGRTTHQALPVEAGIKYAANAWFHQVRSCLFTSLDRCAYYGTDTGFSMFTVFTNRVT